jgi:hypothetical protein
MAKKREYRFQYEDRTFTVTAYSRRDALWDANENVRANGGRLGGFWDRNADGTFVPWEPPTG